MGENGGSGVRIGIEGPDGIESPILGMYGSPTTRVRSASKVSRRERAQGVMRSAYSS